MLNYCDCKQVIKKISDNIWLFRVIITMWWWVNRYFLLRGSLKRLNQIELLAEKVLHLNNIYKNKTMFQVKHRYLQQEYFVSFLFISHSRSSSIRCSWNLLNFCGGHASDIKTNSLWRVTMSCDFAIIEEKSVPKIDINLIGMFEIYFWVRWCECVCLLEILLFHLKWNKQ